MAKKIAICNLKGGVAKTSTTFNLAINLSRLQNKKILLIDGDLQGDLTSACGLIPSYQKVTITELLLNKAGRHPLTSDDLKSAVIETEYANIDLIACNMENSLFQNKVFGLVRAEELLKRLITDSGWDDVYDYILIDCPPSIGMIVTNILVAADEIIIPLDNVEAVRNIGYTKKAISEAKIANPKLVINGVVLVKQKLQTVLHKELVEEIKENLTGAYIYNSIIRDSTVAATAMGIKEPLIMKYPKAKVTQDYIEFTNEFLEKEAR